MKRTEPIPSFREGEQTMYRGDTLATVLKVSTYCPCCNLFKDEATYAIKETDTGEIHHKVPDSRLFCLEETHD